VKATVHFKSFTEVVHHTPPAAPKRSIQETYDVDVHFVEDADSVNMHAHGYLLVVDTDGAIFLYPTTNVVKAVVQ
jgi:hypothetical protein